MDLRVHDRKAYFYSGGKAFDAQRPSVVFIHGAQQDHCVWVLQSRYLAHHGNSVLAVDLPGHGRSEGPPLASVEAIADWVIALLDATRDNEPLAQDMVNLWSHSAYAHYPSNPGPGFWVMGQNLRLMQRQRPGVMHTDFAACNSYSAGMERAAAVRCPALFVLGRQDVMTPARSGREVAKAIAGARVVEIAGAGHALMAEKPDEVLDALVSFIQDSRAGGES